MITSTHHLLYGKTGMELRLPGDAAVLEGKPIPALPDADAAIRAALAAPIGSKPLAELLRERRPGTVAITISDVTRPVPNAIFLPHLLRTLNDCGIPDGRVVIIVGTGMHRHSTPVELEALVGPEIRARVEVVDHNAHDAASLVCIREQPPVSVCRRFAEAEFRIVTGFIEPHFMAGFSGGRKGVCPALVDLATVQRFHGFETLADSRAREGNLEGNPCHAIALDIARAVGVDFLFNVALARDRKIAAVCCGDLEAAHAHGCAQVAEWTTAAAGGPYDLVVTNGGGFPLDQTFYQTVKGMVTALPALSAGSTLLVAAHCGEGLGSRAYAELMLHYANDWRAFLRDAGASRDHTKLDQWQYQMQCRTLAMTGVERLRFVSDGIPLETQRRLSVTPVEGAGDARERAQRFLDDFLRDHPGARVAVIPDGPYVMLT